MVRSAGIQIGELSRRTGCNIETIRYYERITLLAAPARSAGRYRVYGSADVRRLTFIRRARELTSPFLFGASYLTPAGSPARITSVISLATLV
jgi:hypothetical protein